MRLFLIASACVLVACGSSQSSQANNASANASANTATAAVVAAPVSGAKAAAIMHERHEGMEALGKAMRNLHRQLESGSPDINLIRAQTSTMASAGGKIPGWFPAGTGPDVGKTRAKAEIWTQHDLFLRKAKDYAAAAQAVDAAARAGDLNKVMALHDDLDKACKGCHQPFRAPEH
jgi:cytochrome c556